MANKSYWENIVSGSELQATKRKRNKPYILEKIPKELRASKEAEGYSFITNYKDNKHIKMKKEKPLSEQFENEVWILLASMGFTHMNKDESFVIPYSESGATQQVDVFATDGEIALIIECKSAEKAGTRRDFKKEIEAINGTKGGIIDSIKKQFGRDIVPKFIWATKNLLIGDENRARLKDFDIEIFDENAIEYYSGLAQHLGSASKYQLLGKLFSKKDIKKMDCEVPAIKGQMGGLSYYSFSIEPERLLKIGYVLHRNDANKNLMPTYQRIIKKDRLKKINEFVNKGGYFPNSIVISIDAQKPLQFDRKGGSKDSGAKLGILHLPQKYASAFIVDGQHRLYGYADSKFATSNTIPVIAFENLSKEDQVRLFIDINENQKAVSKNLRNTLNSDLLWYSDKYSERRKALRLRIGERLGEDSESPLFEHIIIGENSKTPVRCVTLDSIEKGLSKGKFLTNFRVDNRPQEGVTGFFDSADETNDYAEKKLYPFLVQAFKHFQDSLPEEWNRGEDNQGILTNNVGVQAFLRIFSDIVEYLSDEKVISTQNDDIKSIISKCTPYFDSIVDFYKAMDSETRAEIKRQLGGNGPVRHWRYLQKAIINRFSQFKPDGYDEWWADNSKTYNNEASEKLQLIEMAVKDKISGFMKKKNGPEWLQQTLSGKAYDELRNKNIKVNDNLIRQGLKEQTLWETADFHTCKIIANIGNNWSSGLDDILTIPSNRNRQMQKSAKIKWLDDLGKIQLGLKNIDYSVSGSDNSYIADIYRWIFEDD